MKYQQTNKHSHPGLWQASQTTAELAFGENEQQSLPTEEIIELAKRCQRGQWITVVGGQRHFIAELLAAGIAKERIRWLRTADSQQRSWAIEQAILAGNSGIVVGWLPSIDARLQQRIRLAGRLTTTKSFLFEEDTLLTHLH